MRRTLPIHILWDSSHIWGLMAYRAIKAKDLPCRLTKAQEIPFFLKNKKQAPKILLVPGGNARLKAKALGLAGLTAIRDFVRYGGIYLGFCGGAGLALKHSAEDLGLNLCPWERKPYHDRLQHLVSGHLLVKIESSNLTPAKFHGRIIPLPVWWPGRFLPDANKTVQILAEVEAHAADFWLGDLPLKTIPREFFQIWQDEYGVNLSADFLQKTPLIITGTFGQGRYILSYSHLETPKSPAANKLLAHILEELTGLKIQTPTPTWDLSIPPKYLPTDPNLKPLGLALHIVQDLFKLGQEQHLFFPRTPWLFGWKSGLPGAQLNSLHSALVTLLNSPISQAAYNYWQGVNQEFLSHLKLFRASAAENLLTHRVAQALDQGLPPMISQQDLKERSRAIFGSPLDGGGILAKLLDVIEEMIFLSQVGE